MQKIPTLFERNHEGDGRVRDEVTPGCEWVIAGEGRPTEKIDGTCCLVRAGRLYKRYVIKKGRSVPEHFEAAQEADAFTGHIPGWLPIGDGPEDAWHREALNGEAGVLLDGTYELIGPKVQGNPHNCIRHQFVRHGAWMLPTSTPRRFDDLRKWMQRHQVEGIVWHHPDGRMAKLKRRDFGFEWPIDDED